MKKEEIDSERIKRQNRKERRKVERIVDIKMVKKKNRERVRKGVSLKSSRKEDQRNSFFC